MSNTCDVCYQDFEAEEKHEREYTKLRLRLEIALEALEFYADPDNKPIYYEHENDYYERTPEGHVKFGTKARVALKNERGSGGLDIISNN
jgi:hypothetical protein